MKDQMVKRLRRRVVGTAAMQSFEALAAIVRVVGWDKGWSAERHGLRRIRNIPYRDTGLGDHTLDVFQPIGFSRPWPVLLYVHGGGFQSLSKDTHRALAVAFARRGTMVININYRLAPKHPFPAAIEDVAHAFVWLTRHVESLGGDLGRLAFAGESAGANLVTALTACCCMERPEPWARRVWDTGIIPHAVLPKYGLLQVSDTARFQRRRHYPRYLTDVLEGVELGYLGSRSRDDVALADPLLLFEAATETSRRLPAFYIPCGTADPLLDDSRRLDVAVRNLGARSRLAIFPGGIHAFNVYHWRKGARRCWREMFGFLDIVWNRSSAVRTEESNGPVAASGTPIAVT